MPNLTKIAVIRIFPKIRIARLVPEFGIRPPETIRLRAQPSDGMKNRNQKYASSKMKAWRDSIGERKSRELSAPPEQVQSATTPLTRLMTWSALLASSVS